MKKILALASAVLGMGVVVSMASALGLPSLGSKPKPPAEKPPEVANVEAPATQPTSQPATRPSKKVRVKVDGFYMMDPIIMVGVYLKNGAADGAFGDLMKYNNDVLVLRPKSGGKEVEYAWKDLTPASASVIKERLILNTDDGTEWFEVGKYSWQLGVKERANYDFNKAVALNPELADAVKEIRGTKPGADVAKTDKPKAGTAAQANADNQKSKTNNPNDKTIFDNKNAPVDKVRTPTRAPAEKSFNDSTRRPKWWRNDPPPP